MFQYCTLEPRQFHSLVLTKNSDVNARFSGISLDQLDKAVMDIKAVRAAALMFIGQDTVLVGHGWAPRVPGAVYDH